MYAIRKMIMIVLIALLVVGLVAAAPPKGKGKSQCRDGIDNDGDGLIDYPNDPGCSSKKDRDESDSQVTECSDGIDNDGDGLVDYPNDPGCGGAGDDSELGVVACDDGVDNDGDGSIDLDDIGCSSPTDDDEYNCPQTGCGNQSTADVQVDFSQLLFQSKLSHGINEKTAIGFPRDPIVDQYRNEFGFDSVRYWLVRTGWKVKYNHPTTLPSNFIDDPDLQTIDEMLAEAKETGAELQLVIAHAPDHLLPDGYDGTSSDKNKIGIHPEKYDEFRQYVLNLVQYLAYDSPNAVGTTDFVFEIWNEPSLSTFDNLGKTYVDIINEVGADVLQAYPGITIASGALPYFSGFTYNDETENFYRNLDEDVASQFRIAHHLYNEFWTGSNPTISDFFANAERLFKNGPQELRTFLQGLGGNKADMPIFIGEHNMDPDKREYGTEMAGKEGAAILAFNMINMIESEEVAGHQFYKYAAIDSNRGGKYGFGLININGVKFDTFDVYRTFKQAIPPGAQIVGSDSLPEIAVMASDNGAHEFVVLVNTVDELFASVTLEITSLRHPLGSFSTKNLMTDSIEDRHGLTFGPYEVKVLQLAAS